MATLTALATAPGAPTGRPAAFAWTWYVDPSGFRIAAPVNWLRWTDGGVTCFREPGGSRLLRVRLAGQRDLLPDDPTKLPARSLIPSPVDRPGDAPAKRG